MKKYAIAAVFALCSPLQAQEQPPAELRPCEDLAGLAPANTTISAAVKVEPGAFTAPVPDLFGPPGGYENLPAFCRVTGSIHPTPESDIRFELWLPEEGWNGKFLQTGNGGAAGIIIYNSLSDPLRRGYAVANTDTGHQGAGGDYSWATGQPQKLIDYQYRAVHELTVVGKALTAARFGREPGRSYWLGCSTGGRQGLKEAQRYPEDYDGIIAGAPASNWLPLMALSVLIGNNLAPGGLPAERLTLLKEAAIAACDTRDGLADRVITDPASCDFDPTSLQCADGQASTCLGPDEIAAAQRMYAGVVESDGEVLMPGTGPASEPQWAWFQAGVFDIGASYFRYVVYNNPEWDPAGFDLDADVAYAEQLDGGVTGAMDPDLSAFTARGGKLITWHGTTDGLIPFGNSVNYHESVVAQLGQDRADASTRFYLVPGMDHCGGGEGAFEVDWLGALERWVEEGQAPAALTALHPAIMYGPPGVPPAESRPFARVICPWPQIPGWLGGNPDEAGSFACKAP